MGKSASCLRCAGGSADPVDAAAVGQSKDPKVERGWSLKKRSSKDRVVSNTAIVESPPSGHKENLQSAAINYIEGIPESAVSEKEFALRWDQKKPQPPAADSCVTDGVFETKDKAALSTSETVNIPESENKAVYTVDEEVSISETGITAASTLDEVATVTDTEDHTDLSIDEAATIPETEDKYVFTKDESVIVTIQSTVRGFLARKELVKNRSAVKLQAAVRGHLVRCQAAGTLRCVQAIAKMQAMVRARYGLLPVEEKADKSNEKENSTRKDLKPPKSRPEVTHTSMSELLKNSFARQLLESTSKSKPMNVKCDPLMHDSSWVWLERWTSLASPGAVAMHTSELEMGQEEKVEDYLFHEENELFSDAKGSFDSRTTVECSKLNFVEEANPLSSQPPNNQDSLSTSTIEYLITDKKCELGADDFDAEMVPANQTTVSIVNSQPDIVSVCDKTELEAAQTLELKTELEIEVAEQLKNELIEESTQLGTELEAEQDILPETGEDNFLSGSQSERANIISAESGVEVQISVTHSANLDDLVFQDAEEQIPVLNSYDSVPTRLDIEANMETTTSSGDDIIITEKRLNEPDHSSIQVGESECGTELSVTSTLDSPDRLEDGVEPEIVPSAGGESHILKETNIKEVELEITSVHVHVEEPVSVGHESGNIITVVDAVKEEKELEPSVSVLQLEYEVKEKEPEITSSNLYLDPEADKELETSVSNLQLMLKEEEKHETSVSYLQAEPELENENSHQASPAASTRSEMTVPESQGTPSSQVSVSTKPKRAKSEKSELTKKHTLLSITKKSPLNLNNDSDGKRSSGNQSKEHKSAKRRTSFGSPKPEIADQELRDSSTSSSLPSYMQATQSAKAKANPSPSHRSSPDVTDKDTFLRKRHSLSSTKDRQASPRLQRASSSSKAQQSSSKSNGTSPPERKWQR